MGPVIAVNCANKGSRNFRRCLLAPVIFDSPVISDGAAFELLTLIFNVVMKGAVIFDSP